MTSSTRTRSWEVLVPIIGLGYFACFAAGLVLRTVITGSPLAPYQLFFIPLATFSALAAIAVWWRPRAGYVAAATMSVVLAAIFFLTRDGNDAITVLSNPGRNLVQFVFYATAVPQFFSTLIYSLLGLWNLRKVNVEEASNRKLPL